MAFTKTWNEDSPAGSDDVAQGDDSIRDFKYGIRERLAIDHYFIASEGSDTKIGYHKTVTLLDQSTPTAVTNAVRLYSKLVGSESELHLLDESSNEYQLTHEQRLWIAALRVASEAQGDLLIRGASVWGRLAIGTANQILAVNSGATAAEWVDPPGTNHFKTGMMLRIASSGAITVQAGVAQHQTTKVVKTANTTLTLATDDDWIGGSSGAGNNTTSYAYLGSDGTLKLSTSAPDAADTAGNTAGPLIYKSISGTYYRCLGGVRQDGSGNVQGVFSFLPDGRRMYESEWISISTNTAYSIANIMGTAVVGGQILVKNSDASILSIAGENEVHPSAPDGYGVTFGDITTSAVKIGTGDSSLTWSAGFEGTFLSMTVSHAKVVLYTLV